jgi:NADPH:quinone reductase-like Zn-dependent oxidoreductase
MGSLAGWETPGFRLFMQSPAEAAAELAVASTLVAEGKLRPLVDSVHALDAAGCAAAYARLRSRRARGKVVVELA